MLVSSACTTWNESGMPNAKRITQIPSAWPPFDIPLTEQSEKEGEANSIGRPCRQFGKSTYSVGVPTSLVSVGTCCPSSLLNLQQ